MVVVVNHELNFLRSAALLFALLALFGFVTASPIFAQTGSAGTAVPVPPDRTPTDAPKIDVKDAVNAIRDLIKKKEQERAEKAKAAAEAAAAKAETAANAEAAAAVKADVIANPAKPVVIPSPKGGAQTPKPRVSTKPVVSRPVVSVAIKKLAPPEPAVIAESVTPRNVEPAAEPSVKSTVDGPAARVVAEPAQHEEDKGSGQIDWNVYAILAAIGGVLVAAGFAAKALMTPKFSLDCAIGSATSRLISAPSVGIPDIAFTVSIPNAQAGVPTNLAFVD
jgi:hypothetical protein